MHAQYTQEPIGSPRGGHPLSLLHRVILSNNHVFVFQAKSLEAYLPPTWILQTKPTLSPYLPQVGDVVSILYTHLV